MATPATLRNAGVADRRLLAITPSEQTVEGTRCARPKLFDDGSFMGSPVYLGEILTDEAGRLVVLGGHGESALIATAVKAITFANNEGWHDDVSDGPVTAQVTLDGGSLEVVPAWVVVAPPNYGPAAQVGAHDVGPDARRGDHGRHAGRASCDRLTRYDILPIFERLAGLQWVNAGFAAGFGWKGLIDLTDRTSSRDWRTSGPRRAANCGKAVANQFRSIRDRTLGRRSPGRGFTATP